MIVLAVMTPPPPPTTFRWDDRLWREVWERNLDAVERHHLAMDVLRRRVPGGLFEARVATELARQWRRHARNLGIGYLLWSVFWGLITYHTVTARQEFHGLPVAMLAIGLIAIGAVVAFRRYLAGYARQYP